MYSLIMLGVIVIKSIYSPSLYPIVYFTVMDVNKIMNYELCLLLRMNSYGATQLLNFFRINKEI